MKKLLIATAALTMVAGTVQAQSSVTAYGRFDQMYGRIDTKTATTSTVTNTGFDGGIGGSRLGFRGTEDLGGGLKANFVFEFGVDAGENSGVASTRLGFADLSGGFGTVRMGRQVGTTKKLADDFNSLGNNTNFTPGDVHAITIFDNRLSNAITYITPTISGLSATAQFADANTQTTSETSTVLANGPSGADGATTGPFRTTTQGKVTALGVNYKFGNLDLGVATADNAVYTAGVPQSTERIAYAAKYNFGFATASLEHSEYKVLNSGVVAAERKVSTLGAIVPVNNNLSFAAQYFMGDRELGTGTGSDTPAADYSGYKARATYAFSKRTGVYGQVGLTETKPNNGTQKTTLEGYGLGMYHTF